MSLWRKRKTAAGRHDSAGPGDPPLRFRHILLVTYGRSGSTLLQGVLNTIDGVVLRGENGNIFFNFFKTYRKIVKLKRRRPRADQPYMPWYGIGMFDEEALLEKFREAARVILLADRADEAARLTYGFKEIRYNETGDRLDAYLNFLARLFPGTAFVFNTRDLEDVCASGWWKEQDKAEVVAELQALEQRFQSFAAGRDDCHFIRYEDVVENGAALAGLFEFLGAPHDPAVVDRVLQTAHSYEPEQAHVQSLENG